MLQRVSSQASPTARSAFDVAVAAIATAVPAHRFDQADATARANAVFPHLTRFDTLYANCGVETRYAVQPMEWYLQPHGWEERTEVFQRHALELLECVARAAIAKAGLDPREIDAIVVNTITGLAIPSLDALLAPRLGLRQSVERLPIFGLGCGGGVAGLARATRMAQAMPGSHVLLLTVDLCSLCFRPNDPSKAMFVSGALFGDGAAAVILRNVSAEAADSGGGRIVALGEHLWPGTERIMGWDIKGDGFGVVLSPELPALLQRELHPALSGFLDRAGLHIEALAGFLLHPGGRKVLETAEDVLALPRGALEHSWAVLRDFGNMSSATALFVLDRAVSGGVRGRQLLAAFGPGFSAYFVVIDL